MKRADVLAILPSYGRIEADRDCYLHHLDLYKLIKEHPRYWRFHLQPTTVALPHNRYAKSLTNFHAHRTEPEFYEFLNECISLGCPRPSGYADVFHKLFKSPRVPYSVNQCLADAFRGGWQEKLDGLNTIHRGPHYRYDIRSAYLWAASLGFPDTASYVRSKRPNAHNDDGLYRIILAKPSLGAPAPFNRECAGHCLATNLEIDTYGLKVARVVDGVRWSGSVSGDSVLSCVRAASFWKCAARAFWGRWAQSKRVECVSRDKKWHLPNPALNIPWAHLIISRVRMRVWEYSTNAVHVYVDSVITPERLPTGAAIGDWRLEEEYPEGVFVRAPGQYGSLGKGRFDKMAGVPIDSPLRTMVGAGE